jgi:type I restriction enzyme S subunit
MTARQVCLGDVADLLVGFAFKSAQFLQPSDTGINLVRGDNVQQGFLRWGDRAMKWSSGAYEDFARYQLQLNDLVLAMDRPIVGGGLKLAWVKASDLPCLLVQRVTRIRGLSGVADTNYLRFALSAPDFIAHIDRITTGANIPHISGKDISAFSFRLPPLDEQLTIVEKLLAYDDLIENNSRRIALLEESARLLYREWFVHLRFPGHDARMESTEVPEGWNYGCAVDFVRVLSGGTPDTKNDRYWDGDIPFFTPKDCKGSVFVQSTEKSLTEDGLAACNSPLFPKMTIFITARGTVGKLALAQQPMAMNQSCYALAPKSGINNLFLFLALEDRIAHLKTMASGGVFDAIVVDTFKKLPFLCPPAKLTDDFGLTVLSMFDQIENLLVQNARLTEARDALLPKLMSGEIAV